MSYEPLHHKYRPQTFAQLVGQEAIALTLTNAIGQNKIAPAYLFAGPRGTGKTSSARILAKSLNCLSSRVPTAQPCGTCAVCREITKGSSLDVIEIDAASNTGVDNIRELIERAQFAPARCRYKVYCIDECHMLSNAAFNALLKTLEEPPDRVVFVLATTDPQRVLPTIISRCQRFDFRRIRLEEMVKHLKEIAEREKIAIASEAIALVAQISQGGLRDAESLLDQLSLVAGEVTPEAVWDLVGSVSERDAIALLQAIGDRDPLAVLQQCRAIVDRGREPLILLQNLASFYRDLLIAKTVPERSDLVAVTPATWMGLIELARQWEISKILADQQHLRTCEVQIKNTTQPRLWLEVALLGLLPSTIDAGSSPPPVSQLPIARIKPEGEGQTIHRENAPVNRASETEIAPPTPEQPTPPLPAKPPHKSDSPATAPPSPPDVRSIPGDSRAFPIAARNDPPPSPSPVIEPQADVEPTPSTIHSTDLADIWQRVIEEIDSDGTRSMLQTQCCLGAFDGCQASILVEKGTILKQVQLRFDRIEEAFKKVLNKPVKLKLRVGNAALSELTSSKESLGLDGSTVNPTPTVSTNNNSSVPSSEIAKSPPSEKMLAESRDEAIAFEVPPATQTPIIAPGVSPPTPNTEVSESLAVFSRRQEERVVTEAARSFARTFNGELIPLPDDIELLEPRMPRSTVQAAPPQANAELEEEDDDDIPF